MVPLASTLRTRLLKASRDVHISGAVKRDSGRKGEIRRRRRPPVSRKTGYTYSGKRADGEFRGLSETTAGRNTRHQEHAHEPGQNTT